MKRLLGLMALATSAAFAQTPVVTGIVNNYSGINVGSVAQGAIFIVVGTNLSDTSTGLQSVPLQTTLNTVRIETTVAGVTTAAPMYYVLPTQLAGILPSNTPVGNGTLVVKVGNRTSAAFPITVQKSAFGVLTTTGTSAARVQDASNGYQELTSTRATNPGNYLVFYGSGVGATAGNETVAQTGVNASGDLTTIATTVTIGGKTAPLLYRGRTAFPGLDQINVQVPTLDAATYGCTVAVVITTGGVQANATTIPVAASGSTCPPPSTGGGGGGSTPSQTEISTWVNSGNFSYGSINLGRNVSHSVTDGIPGVSAGSTTTNTTTSFTAVFGRASGLAADLQKFLVPSVGQCTVLTISGGFFPGITFQYYDAGPSITGSGPNGAAVATRTIANVPTFGTTITYDAANLSANFIAAGRYNLSGTGGPNVGAFSGSVDVGDPVVFTNWEEAKAIARASGFTVRWTGASSSQYVSISGASVSLSGSSTTFTCLANRSAGSFAIPSGILTQLPASPNFSGFAIRGSLSITGSTNGTRINASGVDFLTANDGSSESVTTLWN